MTLLLLNMKMNTEASLGSPGAGALWMKSSKFLRWDGGAKDEEEPSLSNRGFKLDGAINPRSTRRLGNAETTNSSTCRASPATVIPTALCFTASVDNKVTRVKEPTCITVSTWPFLSWLKMSTNFEYGRLGRIFLTQSTRPLNMETSVPGSTHSTPYLPHIPLRDKSA